MAIPRDDLRGNRLDLQAQLFRNMGFDLRVDIGEGADGARNGAGGNFFAGNQEARAGTLELSMEGGELDAERGRLRVDAVAAADGRRQLVLEGALFEGSTRSSPVSSRSAARTS
jgi:hypothetical protein